MKRKGACSSGGKLWRVQKGPWTLSGQMLLPPWRPGSTVPTRTRVGPALPHQLPLAALTLISTCLCELIFRPHPSSLRRLCSWELSHSFASSEQFIPAFSEQVLHVSILMKTWLSLRIFPPLQPSQVVLLSSRSTAGLGSRWGVPLSPPLCFQMTSYSKTTSSEYQILGLDHTLSLILLIVFSRLPQPLLLRSYLVIINYNALPNLNFRYPNFLAITHFPTYSL